MPELDEFNTIITCNDVEKGRGKPHPDSYLAGAMALGVSPEEAIFVEDSASGILSGKKALLAKGLVRPEPKSKTLKELQEIPDLLTNTHFTNIIAVQKLSDQRIKQVLELYGTI